MRGGRGRSAKRAMSLIETLVAFVVALIALVALLATLPTAFVAANQAAIRLQALGAAQAYMDQIRQSVEAGGNASLPVPPAIAIDPGESMTGAGTAASSSGYFSLTNNGCPPVGGSGERFDCAVTVTWQQASATRSLALETYVTRQ